jgi:hypothetical protein
MSNNEIKITKLTADSLAKVLDGIVYAAITDTSNFQEESIFYRSSLRTLISILKELK